MAQISGASIAVRDLPVEAFAMIGKSVSHYRIIEKLGQGGMGEVYRAEDTNLHRHVAIKALPEEFAHDAERLARFQREAEVLSSLNHPNIATLYGLEESDGKRFIIMELVEGETLAHRFMKGPLPVEEALQISRQIAEGLEAAHEKGVIHRDLKPGNVMITTDDKVKILDFGLAKAVAAGSAAASTESPTITEAMTRAGTILGTAAYMSPEQAKGKPIDKRADIWAFGCVLYECLTGKRAFGEETVSESIASILGREPDWSLLPATCPEQIGRLLNRCLLKNSSERIRDIGDVRFEILDALSRPAETARHERHRRPGLFSVILIAGVLAGASGGVILWRMLDSGMKTPVPVQRLSILLPQGLTLGANIALSPDGQTLVFSAQGDAGPQLFLRRLDDMEIRPLKGTEQAMAPFFSPDGEWVAYTVPNQGLYKIQTRGGAALSICKFGEASYHGACWAGDGRIIFSGGYMKAGLWVVSPNGGEPSQLVAAPEGRDKVWYVSPDLLPGGEWVIFTVWRGGHSSVSAFSTRTAEVRTLIESGSRARYVSTGHLVYESEGQLCAVAFEPQRLELRGSTVAVVEDVGKAGPKDYDISRGGTLAYVPSSSCLSRLVWRNRTGESQPLKLDPRPYALPALSPDGLRLVDCMIENLMVNCWIGNVDREPLTRLISGNDNEYGIFSPDDKWVYYTSNTSRQSGISGYNIFRIRADGAEIPQQVTFGNPQKLTSFSPDGTTALVNRANGTDYDIYAWAIDRPDDARPFVKSPYFDVEGTFSPDGRWVAYQQADESGRFDIFVQPYPGPGPKNQISVKGGTGPVWNPNGGELFYRTAKSLMAAQIENGRSKSAATQLFAVGKGSYGRDYAVSPDGRRFLLVEPNSRSQINIVNNWFEELNRLIPTGKK